MMEMPLKEKVEEEGEEEGWKEELTLTDLYPVM
jgi:hypothetical protein